MKKIILFISLIVNCVPFFAAPPNLAMEKLFDGRFNTNRHVETTIYKNNGKFYRGVTVKGDSKVISEIEKAMNIDKERAFKYAFHQDKGGSYTSMHFINHGDTIFTGLQIESPGTGFFYIQANEKAFQ